MMALLLLGITTGRLGAEWAEFVFWWGQYDAELGNAGARCGLVAAALGSGESGGFGNGCGAKFQQGDAGGCQRSRG